MFVAQISDGRYVSKSSTTIREAHLEKEAQMCRNYIIAHLSTQENLTITFDGQSIRKPQPIYTVHVTTADRRTFLVKGDISFESHTAEYVKRIISEVIEGIGAPCFAATCSDNTGNTRKGRRLICETYKNILDLADCKSVYRIY